MNLLCWIILAHSLSAVGGVVALALVGLIRRDEVLARRDAPNAELLVQIPPAAGVHRRRRTRPAPMTEADFAEALREPVRPLPVVYRSAAVSVRGDLTGGGS